MKVVYVGESPSRIIIAPGGGILAVRDEPVDVPDDIARSLLEQDVFVAAKAPKKEQD